MGRVSLYVLAVVCVVYVVEGRSTVDSSHHLETRGAREPRAPNMIGGYLYGKRSRQMSEDIMKTITRQYLSIEDVAALLQKDEVLAMNVAAKLDTNGDGFVSMGDLL